MRQRKWRSLCPLLAALESNMLKILLVEDELLIQKSLKKLLEKRGHVVTPAARGKQALEILAENDFDRVVCDLMLGDISGFDVIEESKKFFSRMEISEKFVIITAYSSSQVLERAKSYGCPVLSKPFLDMNHALEQMIGQK